MATSQLLASGTWRVSSTSGVFTQTFSNTVSCSAWLTHEVVVLPNVSDHIVSLPQFSNCQVFGFQANQVVRVNFSAHASYVSSASAGWQCTQWVWMGSNISGLVGLHIANSGSDSATCRIIFGI